MAENRPGLNLSAKKTVKEEKASSPPSSIRASKPDVEEKDNAEDDDEVVVNLPEKSKKNGLFLVSGAAVVILVIAVFLLFRGGRNKNPLDIPEPTPTATSTPYYPMPSQEPQASTPPKLGTQDFTGNTNMKTSDRLDDPDMFVEDIYGLTTRVDYTVNSITNVADFVSYTKHRGTWGGGLELYWLEATYKNNKYVIQIPFKYYKELDETGIVPVKMEVLSIEGATPNEPLTVISYMCLDEETLKEILKSQGYY